MKELLTVCMLLVSYQVASAQHDLYKWQVNGYTGIANYANEENNTSDYFKINHNLLHRLELTRHIGSTFGMSAGYSYGNVRGNNQQLNPFKTDVHMAALRAYFYTDNGWMFSSSSWVAPYFFAGYGLSTLETKSGGLTENSRHVAAVPFGMGLKFRITERWQLALQAEGVYLENPHLQQPALEQNDYNNAYLHTGIRIGYSFGFRKSAFKAPQFYAGNVALLQPVEVVDRPRQNALEMMLQLEPRQVQLSTVPEAPQPVIWERINVESADTPTPADSIVETDGNQVIPAESGQVPDTTANSLRTISSASTIIRMDSVVGNNTIQPAPAVRERVQVAEKPVVVTQQRVQMQDSVITNITTKEQAPTTTQEAVAVRTERSATVRAQEAAPVRTEQSSPARTQEASPVRSDQRAPVRVQPEAPLRASETARVVERPVYVPSENRPAPVPRTDVALLREERLRLNAVNAENRRLQSRIDSLQAVPPANGIPAVAGAATVDTSMVQYLKQQAALNDSMLQRLNQYEQELALLRNATAAPAPTEVAPVAASAGYTTATVFYPINVHRVPPASLRDLNQVLKALQENPAAKVKLTGYTSQSGNAAYNLALSRRRVQALKNFLTDQGIAENRISTEYLGDEKSSRKENPLDRKVEVQIFGL